MAQAQAQALPLYCEQTSNGVAAWHSAIRHMAVSFDGRLLAVSRDNGLVFLHDLTTLVRRQYKQTFAIPGGSAGVMFAPNPTSADSNILLLFVGNAYHVCIWSIDRSSMDGHCSARFWTTGISPNLSVSQPMTPDGKLIVAAIHDSGLQVDLHQFTYKPTNMAGNAVTVVGQTIQTRNACHLAFAPYYHKGIDDDAFANTGSATTTAFLAIGTRDGAVLLSLLTTFDNDMLSKTVMAQKPVDLPECNSGVYVSAIAFSPTFEQTDATVTMTLAVAYAQKVQLWAIRVLPYFERGGRIGISVAPMYEAPMYEICSPFDTVSIRFSPTGRNFLVNTQHQFEMRTTVTGAIARRTPAKQASNGRFPSPRTFATFVPNRCDVVFAEGCQAMCWQFLDWTDRAHHLFRDPEFRTRIFCVMCVRERLLTLAMPFLPTEMWLHIMSFLAARA